MSSYQNRDDNTGKTVPSRRILCFTIIGAVVALIAFGCFRFMPPDPVRAELEQYAVYSPYIESDLKSSINSLGSRDGKLLIYSEPMALHQKPIWRFFAIAAPGFNGNIGSAYSLFLFNRAGRGAPNEFGRKFILSQSYELASWADASLSDSADAKRQHPGTNIFIAFSAIAFSRDLTEALFYTEHHCIPFCGWDDKYIFMRKVNGRWRVEGQSGMGGTAELRYVK